MKNQKSNSGLKAVIVILTLLLGGSLYYTYKLTTEAKKLSTDITTVKSEKENVLDSLNILKDTYDKALEDKSAMSDDLIAEREKVLNLISDLKKSKGDTASMQKYRGQYLKLQDNMKVLMLENEGLKNANQKLTVQRDSTINVAGEQKKYIDTLATQNQNMSEKIERGSKLVITNLKTSSFKERSSGKQVETEKASRANRLKICFTIAANEIAKAGEKTYYVQIIDSYNNVLGQKKEINFGTYQLTYSFTTNVIYNNKNLDVCETLVTQEDELTKGSYFVNVFDKGELVSKSTFSLK
ncbi:MAG: hypothetical protein RLZZ312_302 [Bacteroidota bacterium]|jgi:uncharacterized protein (DUF3084 family)